MEEFCQKKKIKFKNIKFFKSLQYQSITVVSRINHESKDLDAIGLMVQIYLGTQCVAFFDSEFGSF